MIRHLHERYLDELLRDNSISIHHRNIQSLATEKFKIKNEMSPEIVRDIFKRTDTCYTLRNTNNFRNPFANTVHNVTGSISGQRYGILFRMK